jgi:hypothetical protein
MLTMGGKETMNEELIGYADSGFATDQDTAQSPGGMVFKWGNSVIINKSKWFSNIFNSSSESELEALFIASKKAIWLKELLNSLGYSQQSINIFEDNEGAINYVLSNDRGGRLCHSDRKYLWIREKIDSNMINVLYIPTALNIADINTKTLAGIRLQQHRDGLNLKRIEEPVNSITD